MYVLQRLTRVANISIHTYCAHRLGLSDAHLLKMDPFTPACSASQVSLPSALVGGPSSADPAVQRLHNELKEVNRKILNNELDIPPEGERSPSPEPQYDRNGVRLNTREVRIFCTVNIMLRFKMTVTATSSSAHPPFSAGAHEGEAFGAAQQPYRGADQNGSYLSSTRRLQTCKEAQEGATSDSGKSLDFNIPFIWRICWLLS